MALKECAAGHVYDDSRYPSCPYCNSQQNFTEFGSPGVSKTVMGGGSSGISKTVMGGGADSYGRQTVIGGQNMNTNIGKTVAPSMSGGTSNMNTQPSSHKTVAVFNKQYNTDPVLGWFVCIEGKDIGRSYSITRERCTIGKSDTAEIQIKGDPTVSRSHAKVIYDRKNIKFKLAVADDSSSNVWVNDETVDTSVKLNAYDVIELGETKLIFIPFCSERFSWPVGNDKNGEK